MQLVLRNICITIHSLKPQFYETENVRLVIGLLILWEISGKFLRNCASRNRASVPVGMWSGQSGANVRPDFVM